MLALQRHQLVWLDDAGWRAVLAPADEDLPWPAAALPCLQHWAEAGLPLVVTRQPAQAASNALTLGLAAPERWGRQRWFVSTQARHIRRVGGFPPAAGLQQSLPAAARAAWPRLCAKLALLGVPARVYGSHGWQALSGLAYVHAQSDLDLLLPCASLAQADALAARLPRAGFDAPRLDGEMVFSNGAAVAWREWSAWRAGRAREVLVKRLHGAALEDPSTWRMAA